MFVVTLLLNLLVAGAKGVYGWLSGSVSLTADAFHSLLDAASNILALVGMHLSSSPADAGHLRQQPPQDHFRLTSAIGSVRTRMPVAAKIALHTAGAAAGRPGSPNPVGGAEDLMNSTSTTGGTRFIRSIG